MSKKHKLYVSFASDDNSGGNKTGGWVDNFIRFLSVYIQRINNESPEIIQLDGNKGIPALLSDDEGLIVIASKNYLNKNLAKGIVPLITDVKRVFKIDLEPLKKSEQPKELRSLNEFHFFESQPGNDIYESLSSSGSGQNFWLKIIDLAFEINRTVFKKPLGVNDNNRKKVYLAETSYDQVHNRDELKRELIRHGHTVLPTAPFSGDFKELEAQVKECLEVADLSVHIIGESYGEVPEGSDKSIVEIQNQLSSEYFSSKTKTDTESLYRLIWMPHNLKPRSDQQKLYLDQLKDDIVSTSGAEIIQTPLEILKTVIHSRLQLLDSEQRIKLSKLSKRSEKKSVYLLYDKKDAGDIDSFIKDIQSKNIEVILPKFDGKQIEFLESHRDSLVKSDGVLLYANKNLNWVNSKINDVIKAPGFGKNFPFDAKAIYIKDSSIPKEKIAVVGDIIMLNGDGKSKANDISPFLNKFASS